MALYIFRSTDSGAPSISGTAGALITTLDALLKDGYGSVSVTLVRSGSTVTATGTHNLTVGSTPRLLIAGASPSDYNGEFVCTVTDSTHFTYQIVTTPGSATGSITAKRASMGWTKPLTGTNKAAYLQPAGSNQFYLRLDDSGAQDARIRGYETMSDVDTGTGLFPTDAQVSGGLYLDKSSAASGTARPWLFFGNGKMFYLFVQQDGSLWAGYCFGDIATYKSGDAYHTVIIGNTSSQLATTSSPFATQLASGMSTGGTAHYIARAYTQVGTSLNIGKFSDYVRSASAASLGSNGLPYPSNIEGGLHLAPIYALEPTQGARGQFPGWWNPLHSKPLTHGDTFSGVTGLSGRTFEAISLGSSFQCFMETSDTWDS